MADASVERACGRVRAWRNVSGGVACLITLWACGDSGAGDGRRPGAAQESRALTRMECDSVLRIASAPPEAAGQGAAAERNGDLQAAVEWCEQRVAARGGTETRERPPGAESDRMADRSQRGAAEREAAAQFAAQVPPARQELASAVPAGATLILVDQSTLPADFAAGRTSIPFLEREGVYWGPPADDETAIRELERLRQERGARYIAFAWPAFWWLDQYSGFAAHLRNNFRTVLNNERLVVFDLGS